MLQAIIDGTDDPELLANLAQGWMKNKKEELRRALHGLIGSHQRLLLATQLEHIDFLNQQIACLDQEIAERMRPFEEDLELLDTIPGVGRRVAEEILAETDGYEPFSHRSPFSVLGVNVSRYNKSAGKNKSGRTTKGNKSLRSTLVNAAHAAAHTKDTYLSARYHRIAARRGANRAAVAVGHTILVIVYQILKSRQPYKELSANYLDRRKKEAIVKQAIKKLETLGYKVNVEEVVA